MFVYRRVTPYRGVVSGIIEWDPFLEGSNLMQRYPKCSMHGIFTYAFTIIHHGILKFTPWKIDMEPKSGGGWKMIFLSQFGDFQVNHVKFQGCNSTYGGDISPVNLFRMAFIGVVTRIDLFERLKNPWDAAQCIKITWAQKKIWLFVGYVWDFTTHLCEDYNK